MTAAIARDPIYRCRRLEPEIIELCVRWYLTYRLSYRDLVEMLAERGVTVSQSAGTLRRSSLRNLLGKIPPELSWSLIPWRSSRPNPFLDRQQSRVECIGVGTSHDPLQ
jgi:hypothetical protein